MPYKKYIREIRSNEEDRRSAMSMRIALFVKTRFMKPLSKRSYVGLALIGLFVISVSIIVVRSKAHQDRVTHLQNTLSSDEKKIALFESATDRIRKSGNEELKLDAGLFKNNDLPEGIGIYQVYADRFGKLSQAIKTLRTDVELGVRSLPRSYPERYQAAVNDVSQKADTCLEATTSMRSTFLGIMNSPLLALGMNGDSGREMGSRLGKTMRAYENSVRTIYDRLDKDVQQVYSAKSSDFRAIANAESESFIQGVITE